jgi:hypothetical protein
MLRGQDAQGRIYCLLTESVRLLWQTHTRGMHPRGGNLDSRLNRLRGQDAQARMDPYLAESQLSVTSTVVRASLPESFRVSFPDSFRAPVRLCACLRRVSVSQVSL